MSVILSSISAIKKWLLLYAIFINVINMLINIQRILQIAWEYMIQIKKYSTLPHEFKIFFRKKTIFK